MGDSDIQRVIELERKFIVAGDMFWTKSSDVCRFVQIYGDFDDEFKRMRIEASADGVVTVMNRKAPVLDYQGAALEIELTLADARFVQEPYHALVKYRRLISTLEGSYKVGLYLDYVPSKGVFYLECESIFTEDEFQKFRLERTQEAFADECYSTVRNFFPEAVDVTGDPSHSARASAIYMPAHEINDDIRTQESFHRIQKLRGEGFQFL